MIRSVILDHNATALSHGHLYPGAAELVRQCAERFPVVLTTSHSHQVTERDPPIAQIRNLLLDIISADEVERGKPAPDILIATLGRIGFLLRDRNPVEPLECLVVDSTPLGVIAARGAGMRSLALTHTFSREELSAADVVRDSFDAVDLDQILRFCVSPRP